MRPISALALFALAAWQPTFEELCSRPECTEVDAGVRDLGVRPDGGDAAVDPPDAEEARVGWIAATTEGPAARDRHVMVYSPKSRALILTGAGQPPGDMWMWTGAGWTRLADPPFGRIVDAIAAEDANGDVVFFGGRDATENPRNNNTWTWNGVAWTQRFPADAPRARIFSAIAYDQQRRVSVLFGGIGTAPNGADVVLGDTWEWDGENWAEIHPPSSPAPRGFSAMTYDPERERVVLFAGGTGEHEADIRFSDLYSWDGEIWEELTVFGEPPARCDHAMAYDLSRRSIIIFGGADYFPLKNDTWELRDSRWTQITEGAVPVGVTISRMDYDRAGQRMLMWGGWNNFGHEGTTYLLGPVGQ